MMKKAFASIVDVNFTAMMEGLLDMVEEGKVHWKSVIENFYPDFEIAVQNAEKELEKVKIEDEVQMLSVMNVEETWLSNTDRTEIPCMPGIPRMQKYETTFRESRNPMSNVWRRSRLKENEKGRKYYGCENNPECEFMSWQKPSTVKCEKCGSYMIEKGKKLVCSNKECGFVCSMPEEAKRKKLPGSQFQNKEIKYR